MKRLVIFDLDGTLIEYHSINVPCPCCEIGWREGCSACDGSGMKTFHDPKLYQRVDVLPHRKAVIDTLRTCKVEVAIATNQTDVAFARFSESAVEVKCANVEFALGPFEWAIAYGHPLARWPYNDPSQHMMRKPDPATLLALCRRILPDRVLFVGDATKDQQAADAAGIEYMDADVFFETEAWSAWLHDTLPGDGHPGRVIWESP